MKSLFNKLIKPNLVIVGEVINSIRAKQKTSPSGPTDIFPSGESGYNPVAFSGLPPTNLNESGFYEIKSINIGITDLETATELIRSSFSDSNSSSYQNISVVSLDGLFVPFSTDPNHILLPHFEDPTSFSGPNSKTLNPFDPNSSLSSGTTPVGYPTGVEGAWLASGHNINLAASYDSSTQVTDLNFDKDYWNRGSVAINEIRSVAIRSPIILSGWGFDTNGIPVPSGSGGTFHAEAFNNPNLWKTGPVDLRWDDDRKVWSASSIQLSHGIVLSKCSNLCNTYVVRRVRRTVDQDCASSG